jgi:hypothetical protein
VVLTVPGTVIVMTPSHVHVHLLVLLSAGIPPIVTVGDPGTHGAGSTGTHGAGVGVPSAAAVAAITAGLVGAMHIPNVGIFVTGTWSMMVAAGRPSASVRFTGSTTRLAGVIPKLQVRVAPMFTSCAIAPHPPKSRTEDVTIAYNTVVQAICQGTQQEKAGGSGTQRF